jgi:hypothetical protein
VTWELLVGRGESTLQASGTLPSVEEQPVAENKCAVDSYFAGQAILSCCATMKIHWHEFKLLPFRLIPNQLNAPVFHAFTVSF